MEIFEKIFTKKQFIFELANTLQITESNADLLFDTFFGLIIKELIKGKKVVFRDFGTFYLHTLKPQIKTMPNQRKVETKENTIVRFKSGRMLRRKLTCQFNQLNDDKKDICQPTQ